MKKTKTLLAVSLLSISLFGIASCDGGNPNDGSNSSITTEMSLSETSLELLFGDSVTLIAKGGSSLNQTSWESSDESVAIVSEGKVTAVGKGDAIITAKNGTSKATCSVNVSFGDILPSLVLENIIDDGIYLANGASFALKGSVSYNDKLYSCPLSVSLASDGILSLDGNNIVALKEGNTSFKVRGRWNGFDNSLMEKTIRVKVSRNVSMYCEVMVNGTASVSNELHLSVIPAWQGISYTSKAKIAFKVDDDGVTKDAEIIVSENEFVSISEDGEIIAKKNGSTRIYGQYTDAEGNVFTTFITAEITCPLATYEEEIRFSSESPFPLDTYFGEDASISYVKQGDRELEFTPAGLIKGLEAKGDASEPLTILTNRGGFYFENPFIYTRVLDASNFKSTLQLSIGRIVDGYYILDSDIDTVIDMTGQGDSYYQLGDAKSRYFKGTFDGQGHTLKVKVGQQGIFGGLGEQCVIKNTHFDFTFVRPTNKGYHCSGIARNNWTNNVKGWEASLSNLYITTTNFYEDSHALFEIRFNNLKLNDIYVNLTLDESFTEVTSAAEEKGALFRTDNTISAGPYGSYYGDFRNVRVVTNVFMPIASGKIGGKLLATYANNDTGYLGTFSNGGVASQVMYCVLNSKKDNPKIALFGENVASWYFKDDKDAHLAWVYYSQPTMNDGGIRRYNTVEDLRKAGVNKIGSWNV